MEEILKGISEFVQECLGPLGNQENYGWPDWLRDFCVQALATLLLFLVVRFFLWKPITNLLESRRQAIDKELNDANEIKRDALRIQKELKDTLHQSKIEIQALLEKAENEGNIRKEEIIKEAQIEANRRLELAQEEIALDIQKAEKDIKDQIVSIAFLAAESIVGHEVEKDKYMDIIRQVIDSGLDNE